MTESIDNNINSQGLLDSLNDGAYAVDMDRKILYWGPAAERITGWPKEEILGRTCFDNVLNHVDKDGRPLCGKEHCPLHRAMVTGKGSDVPIIVYAKHKDDQRIPMRVSVAPIRDESGEVIGGIETFRDVSPEYHDLKTAKRIQSTMLRGEVLQDPRIEFSTYYLPLDIVGGDYFDIQQLDKDRFSFILADVCGHGATAALYTVYINTLWKTNTDLFVRPAELAGTVSEKLSDLIGEDTRFVTAVFGYVDLSRNQFTVAFAGGPSPMLFRANGEVERIEGSGIPLGCMVAQEYEQKTVPVHPGECFLAFSDGAMEIVDENDKLLGADGLVKLLKEIGYPGSADLAAVEEKLLKHSGRIRFNDDLTFLEVRFPLSP